MAGASGGRKQRYPIHRQAPTLDRAGHVTEMLETGIKVIDLLEPYTTRRQDGLVRRRRGRQDRYYHGAHQ